MYINGTTTGFLLQTMLYLANKTDKVHEKTRDDFLQTPMGADSGKCLSNKFDAPQKKKKKKKHKRN